MGLFTTNWTSDENGNLTVENYVGNKTTFTWDTENRLTKVVQVSGYTEENEYSADGLRRVRLAGTSTITYLWDDHVLLRDNSIFSTLPSAPGGLLASKGGTTHRFYVPDMQGGLRAKSQERRDTRQRGLIQLTAASAMAFGDWGYTWDGKPGRYYVQHRHLRADLGRWMSEDPVETEPPYAYVANRPTWAADPSGEQGGTGGWYEWGRFKQEHREGLGVPLEQFLDMMVNLPLQAGETLWRGFIGWEAAVGDTALRILGVQMESALWSSMRHSKSSSILALAPPQPGPNFVRWTGGLIWGVFETTARMVLGLPADAVRLVKYLLKQGAHILGDLLQFIRSTWGSILGALPELSKLDEYTRGKILGTIIASTIGLFLAGKGALALMKGLPVALKKGIEGASRLSTSLGRAAGALSIRPKPEFLRDAWNQIQAWLDGALSKGARGGTDKGPSQLPTKKPLDPVAYERHPLSHALAPGEAPGTYCYLVDAKGVLYVAPIGQHVHPKILGRGAPAAAAGALRIGADGRVVEIDNVSGTFRHGPETLPLVAQAAVRQGLQVAPGALKPFHWEE